MILDRIQNWALYFEQNSRVGEAMHFLTQELDPSVPDGRIELDGVKMYANVETYSTRPVEKCRFEAHRLYLDIQYIIKGGEIIGWTPTNELAVADPYDSERDLTFYEQPKQFTTLELYEGSFALFYPGDAHQPGMNLSGIETVKKVVVKIRLTL
jgi:biofilm protein TabA